MVRNIYDAECLEEEVLALVQDNMPSKLSAIDTEKGDFVTPPIDNSAYYTDINKQAINVNPFILYGIEQTAVETNGGTNKRTYAITFLVVFIDTQGTIDVRKKAFRYVRALEDVFLENFDQIRNAARIDQTVFLPEDFLSNNGSTIYKAGGVQIEVDVAGGIR